MSELRAARCTLRDERGAGEEDSAGAKRAKRGRRRSSELRIFRCLSLSPLHPLLRLELWFLRLLTPHNLACQLKLEALLVLVSPD